MAKKKWLAVCRQRAEEQALKEARTAWKITSDHSLPFNHRWEHVQEVVKLALWLTTHLDADAEIVEAAAWLHDIAKGRNGDHSLLGEKVAENLCPRLGLSDEETETVAWLVRWHLLMSNVAFKRDLDDPKTIADFAAEVRSLERLKLLLLLTVVLRGGAVGTVPLLGVALGLFGTGNVAVLFGRWGRLRKLARDADRGLR